MLNGLKTKHLIGTVSMDKTLLTFYKIAHGTFHSYSREGWVSSRETIIKNMIKNEEVDHTKEYLHCLERIIHSRRILLRVLYKIKGHKSSNRFGDITTSWDIRRYVDEKENVFKHYFETFSNLMFDGKKFNKKTFLSELLSQAPYNEDYFNNVLRDLENRQFIDKMLMSYTIDVSKSYKYKKNIKET